MYNMSLLLKTLNVLVIKLLYRNNKGLSPVVLIFLKCAVSMVSFVLMTNKDFFKYLYVPKED